MRFDEPMLLRVLVFSRLLHVIKEFVFILSYSLVFVLCRFGDGTSASLQPARRVSATAFFRVTSVA